MRVGRGGDSYAAPLAGLALPEPAHRAIAAYLALLEAWAPRLNLTGAVTAAARVALLVRDVIPGVPHLLPGPVLDIGSGNGSPGLVFAALRPDLTISLLEPRQRRWAFLREATRAMGRPDIQVLRLRHDTYDGAPAANVVVRALALPLRELARLAAPGGQVMVLGRPGPVPRPLLDEGRQVAPGIWTFRRALCST